MKIGVIADVHGDLLGLQRALDVLHAQGVEHIVCAGDLVDKGPATDEIMALFQSDQITSVQGDHDLDACNDGFIYVQRSERYVIEETYALEIAPALSSYLSTLPVALKLEYEGVKLHIAHASTWDQRTFLSPSAEPQHFRRVAAEANAQTVILGHTHLPMVVQVDNCMILNPGCVFYGYPEFRSTCAVLSLPSREIQFFDVDTGANFEPMQVQR